MLNLDFLYNNFEDNRTYQEKTVEKIIYDILTGNLKKGAKLTEQRLCEKYHMSRTPIREILNQLSTTGLVEVIPNRGAFVIGITTRDIEDYFNIRYLLFPQAVKWAIERCTQEKLDMLDEVFSFMEFYSKTEDHNKFARVYIGYNELILDICDNAELSTILSRNLKLLSIAGNTILDDYSIVIDELRPIHEAFHKKNSVQGYEAAQISVYKTMTRRL